MKKKIIFNVLFSVLIALLYFTLISCQDKVSNDTSNTEVPSTYWLNNVTEEHPRVFLQQGVFCTN